MVRERETDLVSKVRTETGTVITITIMSKSEIKMGAD